MGNDYRTAMREKYYSTQYARFIPQDDKGWNWVLGRIESNFGDVFASLPKACHILDVGCGVGYLEDYLLKQGFENIDCVDISPEQIEVAKQKLADWGINHKGKVTFTAASAFDFLEGAHAYDLVAMFDFIEHFKKDEVLRLLNLSYKALNPGGRLLLRTINANNPLFGQNFYHDFTHETPFTPDSIQQCMAALDFSLEKVDYEEISSVEDSLIQRLKSEIRTGGLRVLAKFLRICPKAFSENLVVVARK